MGLAQEFQRMAAIYRRSGPKAVASAVYGERWKPLRKVGSHLLFWWLRDELLHRGELLELAQSSDSLWYFGESEEFRIRDPQAGRNLPHPLQAVIGEYRLDAPFVCEIENGRLVGKPAIGLTSDCLIIIESVEGDPELLRQRIYEMIVSKGVSKTARRLRCTSDSADPSSYGTVFPLVSHPSTNYYHWTLGYLDKVRGLFEYESRTGRIPTVLIHRSSPSWVRESLDLIGVEESQIESWDDEVARVDRLVIPRHHLRYGTQFTPSPGATQWLSTSVRSHVDIDASRPNSRIYVSREDADERRVRNEEEVFETLEDFGFERHVMSELSVREQVDLFANARVIAGPHGAGLVNMIYSKDPTVIELLPAESPRAHYFVLAAQLGYEYHHVLARSIDQDLEVDIDGLRKLLDEVLRSGR